MKASGRRTCAVRAIRREPPCTAGATTDGYGKDGQPFLTKEPKLLLDDNEAGKPAGIHRMVGRRPVAAFGNSTGDRQMLEYTKAGEGARLQSSRELRKPSGESACGMAGRATVRHVANYSPAGRIRIPRT
jgi:hypothetical protein